MRNLIREYLRCFSIDDRGDELIEDAWLVLRDRNVLKASIQKARGRDQDFDREIVDRL